MVMVVYLTFFLAVLNLGLLSLLSKNPKTMQNKQKYYSQNQYEYCYSKGEKSKLN